MDIRSNKDNETGSPASGADTESERGVDVTGILRSEKTAARRNGERGAGYYSGAKRKGKRAGAKTTKKSFKEKFLIQLTVTGAFIAVVLAARLFGSGFAGKLNLEIDGLISKNISVSDVQNDLNSFGSLLSGLNDSVLSAFGQTNKDKTDSAGTTENDGASQTLTEPAQTDGQITPPANAYETALPSEQAAQPAESAAPVPTETLKGERIDEDILNEINARQDPYNAATATEGAER